MKAKRFFLMIILLALCALLSACAQTASELQDGYYTAEAAEFSEYGWKEYITLCVSDGRIVTVEYDAKNASGFVRSWDMGYMRAMNLSDATYPNEYSRSYKVALLNWQNPDEVEVVSGATTSHTAFQMLAEAAISQARMGNKQVAYVELPVSEEVALKD